MNNFKKNIRPWSYLSGLIYKSTFNTLLIICFLSMKSEASDNNNCKLILSSPVLSLYGSDTSTAIFSSRNSLVLNTNSPLVNYYVASTSSLGFANANEAAIFFNNITDNLLSYDINYSTGEVVINIHLQYADAGWTVANWNQYIYSKLNP